MTKLTDQIVALISPEHAKGIHWPHDDDDMVLTSNSVVDHGEDTGRLYHFVVAKAQEKEEKVAVRPGFKVTNLVIYDFF